MKLWQKIFLSTLALMVFSTALVSVLLLKSTRDALWEREGQRAATQQRYLAGMLRAGVVSHRLQLGLVQLEEGDTRDAAVEVLSQQATDDYLIGFVLVDDDGTELLNNLMGTLEDTTLPEPPEDEPKATVYELRDGGNTILCAMPITLESCQYRLGAAYNVADLKEDLEEQALHTVLLSLSFSVLGAGLLLLLTRVLLRPLADLRESAKRIAQGSYEERLTVHGSDELAGLAGDMNQLAQAVQDRVEQLEQVAEERKVFIGNLAHEMKTPLTSILGFADLLYLPKDVSDSKRVKYARVISEEAKRLRSLSGKLLELTTVGSTSVTLEPAPLREVVEEVALSMRPVMANSGITLSVFCPVCNVDMDRELFKSLLYNIMDNARKASQRDSRIDLAGRVEGDEVVLLIRDYGQGIPKEEIAKITRPFYMVDKSRARKAGGAGLGLALCQEITAVHNGSMGIQSIVGEGTLVTLRFPISGHREEPGHEA